MHLNVAGIFNHAPCKSCNDLLQILRTELSAPDDRRPVSTEKHHFDRLRRGGRSDMCEVDSRRRLFSSRVHSVPEKNERRRLSDVIIQRADTFAEDVVQFDGEPTGLWQVDAEVRP